jgi:hypothetical protein
MVIFVAYCYVFHLSCIPGVLPNDWSYNGFQNFSCSNSVTANPLHSNHEHAKQNFKWSHPLPVVYLLIRIREICRTQLYWNLLYLLYSLFRQHVSTLYLPTTNIQMGATNQDKSKHCKIHAGQLRTSSLPIPKAPKCNFTVQTYCAPASIHRAQVF